MEKLFKVLGPQGESIHGGTFRWSLPKRKGRRWIPGEWHSVDGPIEACKNGLHLTDKPFNWYRIDCRNYVAEGRGETSRDADKIAFREARLIEPAPHPLWWVKSKRFIASIPRVPFFRPDGKPYKKWLLFTAVSRNAARDAARNAAWNAVRDVARDAALDAAVDAALDAARDVALDVAWDVAWDVARGAAWDVAWNAVRDVARDAAWDVAWDVALMISCLLVGDKIDKTHIRTARERWRVWQKGYGLAGEAGGVLYVYAGIEKESSR